MFIFEGLSLSCSTQHLFFRGNIGARSSCFWVEGGLALSPPQAKDYDDDHDDHEDNASDGNAHDGRSREATIAPVVGD